MSTHLHIVCLDAPSPPDYGGAIDMFYKIKALAETGKKIILHYFKYNPLRNTKELEPYCEAVYTYKRKSILGSLPLFQPFIVQSRISHELIERLNKDDYPVLLEGLHCSGLIPFLNHTERVVLRMHNEEASYYYHLAKTENSFFKRKYFVQEARLIKTYQQRLRKKVKLACLSQTDIEVFQNDYGFVNTHFIPCFIPWQTLSVREGTGDYCLYHGNMLVSENEEAALWLIRNVFGSISEKLIIAGKGISARLRNEAGNYKNVSLLHNPSISQIDNLIENAQINVLPSMNTTGVKLKLLHAALVGRHCITNYNGVKGSLIENGIVVANEPGEWIEFIQQLIYKPFAIADIEKREVILGLYNNRTNAGKLNALW